MSHLLIFVVAIHSLTFLLQVSVSFTTAKANAHHFKKVKKIRVKLSGFEMQRKRRSPNWTRTHACMRARVHIRSGPIYFDCFFVVVILIGRLWLWMTTGAKAQPDEIVQAEQKLEESLELADNSMYNLLSGDVSGFFLTFLYVWSPC